MQAAFNTSPPQNEELTDTAQEQTADRKYVTHYQDDPWHSENTPMHWNRFYAETD